MKNVTPLPLLALIISFDYLCLFFMMFTGSIRIFLLFYLLIYFLFRVLFSKNNCFSNNFLGKDIIPFVMKKSSTILKIANFKMFYVQIDVIYFVKRVCAILSLTRVCRHNEQTHAKSVLFQYMHTITRNLRDL